MYLQKAAYLTYCCIPNYIWQCPSNYCYYYQSDAQCYFCYSLILYLLYHMQFSEPKITQSTLGDWKFFFSESGIAASKYLDQLIEELGLFQTPSLVFDNNQVAISHASGFSINFNPKQALRVCNFKEREAKLFKLGQEGDVPLNHITYLPEMYHVKHAAQWKNLKKPADIEITPLEASSCSFFISSFKGQLSANSKIQRVNEDVIPAHKLGPENPIKFYHQGSIYEDELDDNGLCHYDYKFRSMQGSWFGLIRCYLRIDDVVLLVLDTRIYWEEAFGNKIARQFMVKKATWQQVKSSGFSLGPEWSTNPHQSHLVYPHLKEAHVDNEYISF